MVWKKLLQKTLIALIGALLLVPLGACRSPGISDPAQAPYSAYRPRFDEGSRRRTLFLGGYAGFNYGDIDTPTQIATNNGGEVWGYPVARPPFSGWFRPR